MVLRGPAESTQEEESNKQTAGRHEHNKIFNVPFLKGRQVLCALCSDAFRQWQLQKIHSGNTAKCRRELQFYITRET